MFGLRIIVCFGILIEYLHCNDHVQITRASEGDQFLAGCCNCCTQYQAYCMGGSQKCRCNFKLTYFKDLDGNEMCVSDPNDIENCQFNLVGLNGVSSFHAHHLTSDTIVGSIDAKNSNGIPRKCLLLSSSYYKIDSWIPIENSDFKLLQSGKSTQLKFIGKASNYEGNLLKFKIKCNRLESCLVFKTDGVMKKVVLPQDSTNLITTTAPKKDSSEKKPSKWLLGVILGVVSLVVLLLIIVLVICLKKRKLKKEGRTKHSKRNGKEKINQTLITENTTDTNRNSLHESTVMYVSDDNRKELDGVYIDPDIVFSDKKPKDSNYDYPYMKHQNFKRPPPEKKKPSDKHEYAAITADHPYDDPESIENENSNKYAELDETARPENPYNDPESIPCPESRKSLGYAELDDIKVKPTLSAYQTLSIDEGPDNVFNKVNDEPDEPNYFQLADDENAI